MPRKSETACTGRVSYRKSIAELLRAIGQLSYTQRETLAAHVFDRRTCREIAEAQHVSIQAIKNRLQRARAKLRSMGIQVPVAGRREVVPCFSLLPTDPV